MQFRIRHNIHGFFHTATRCALLLGLMLGISHSVYAQNEFKLRANDADSLDAFGNAVSVDIGWALVGASQENQVTGAAYLFRSGRSNWLQDAKLVASTPSAGGRFGGAVSLDGDAALIGAPGHDDTGSASGAAFLFRYDGMTWNEEAKLIASDGSSDAFFGGSVSLYGDVALIGTPGADHQGGNNVGAAYVFRRDGMTWTEEAKLTPSDPGANDDFGDAVSLYGDLAIVGAPLNDDDGAGSGSVYVFRYNGTTWSQEAKLTASNASERDRFGSAVSIDGNRILIGAWGYAAESGTAYIFEFNGTSWQEVAILNASDARADDNFGSSVSLSGDTALIGAWSNDDAGSVTGSAYLFEFNGTAWNEVEKLLSGDAAGGDGFGFAVSIKDDQMLIGAPLKDEVATSSGVAYVYGPFTPVSTEEEAAIPEAFALHGNYPNPFNPSTEIRFDLPQAGHVQLTIYDVSGKEVARLVNEALQAGAHALTWDASGSPSGAYLYRLTAGAFTETKVMTLVR